VLLDFRVSILVPKTLNGKIMNVNENENTVVRTYSNTKEGSVVI
jgi:hypothetical protein